MERSDIIHTPTLAAASPGHPSRLLQPNDSAMCPMRSRLPRLVRSASPLRLAFALLTAGTPAPGAGQVDARMFRYPDVSATEVAFVYGGDIWIVPREGGRASRLSSPAGEESFPRFSPDGSRIAFTGNYDGNEDVYVIPAAGGAVERVTSHPMADRMLDWTPDGGALLFASGREAGRQRFNQIFRIPVTGGEAERLPVPYGEFGALSPDGATLAYTPKARDFRTWKRYRGGWAPDIWLFDLQDLGSERITDSPASDGHPMWHGRTIYYLSDAGPEQRYNIWAYDLDSAARRQVTSFTDFDITWPAIGPDDIVFQAGGRLYLMDLATEQPRKVDVEVVTDLATLRPRTENVGDDVAWMGISPQGERAVLEARGDVFTLPAEHGPVLNLTRSSGVAERYPTWSPDGRWIAAWSDRSGEYELTLLPADGTAGEPVKLTSLGAGFRYAPVWSPDSRRLAFVDEAMRLRVYDRESGSLDEVDQSPVWLNHGALQGMKLTWSPDGRWLAFARPVENGHTAVFLWDGDDGSLRQVTSGFYNDGDPAFDPGGKYLYWLSRRSLEPAYSDLQGTWIYPNTTRLVAAPLRRDVASPLAPRNDVEAAGDSAEAGPGEAADTGGSAEGDATPAPVEIDLDGLEARAVVLPPEAGNYADVRAADGKVLYRRPPRTGASPEDRASPLLFWDLEAREEKTVLPDVRAYDLSADGNKALVRTRQGLAIVDVAPDQKPEDTLATGDMRTLVDPRAEWRQIFADAWRFERDFFYDPNMHGVDWEAMRRRYGALVEDVVTREDLNFVLGELIAELNASHTYRGGGDLERPERRNAGLLGVDWSLEGGAWRIARVLEGAPWDLDARSPLAEAGVDAGAGDWVLAVNGIPLEPGREPYEAFEGLAGETVELLVNDRPTTEGARQVLVETLADETRLRHLAWIDANRQRVDEATDGRVGYVYVPDTGQGGQTELVRQFLAQFQKDGLIIDERFNSGGQIPDRFIELLNRPMLSYWAVRHGEDWRWPRTGHRGPEVMLINGWSGSGGDAFPYYFREAGLGPLIGTRTWGGLIGISGAPTLVDGGTVSVPTFRMYSPEGEWFAEGHGVDPDIEVVDDPSQLARGTDPQLERAIREVLRELAENPPTPPARPGYQNRAGGGGP